MKVVFIDCVVAHIAIELILATTIIELIRLDYTFH